MVRVFEESDRENLVEFLSEEAAINLFILGDIENYPFDCETMTVWGGFDNDNNIRSVLLRYEEFYIVYYKEKSEDGEIFKDMILSAKPEAKILSGKAEVLKDFKGIFEASSVKETFFSELTTGEALKAFDDEVKIAKPSDGKRLYEFIIGIKEFSSSMSTSVEKIENALTSKNDRIYFIENEDGEIISQARSSAENSKSAMIVGVATKEGYRNKGLVSKCISKLCSDLINEGKTLCLFYDNPIAGELYKKIGFKDIDNWTMIVRE